MRPSVKLRQAGAVGVRLDADLLERDRFKAGFPGGGFGSDQEAVRGEADLFGIGREIVVAQFKLIGGRMPAGVEPFAYADITDDDVALWRNAFKRGSSERGAIRWAVVSVESFHRRISVTVERRRAGPIAGA